jgi:RNA-splicing ligase RtcB
VDEQRCAPGNQDTALVERALGANMITYEGKHAIAHVMLDVLEDQNTISQIFSFLNDPSFRFSPEQKGLIIIMPDTHYGKGAVIGFTMKFNGRAIPNVVGVDLNCGMFGIRLPAGSLAGVDRAMLDRAIRQSVPIGGGKVCQKPKVDMKDEFSWDLVQKAIVFFTNRYNLVSATDFKVPTMNHQYFENLCNKTGTDYDYAVRSIGSMGGGNHFIEMGFEQNKDRNPWLVVHSGSRNLGLRTANHWQAIARKRDRQRKTTLREEQLAEIKRTLPESKWQSEFEKAKEPTSSTRGLEFLDGKEAFLYMTDCIFLHFYAMASRWHMAASIVDTLGLKMSDAKEKISTVHNYISHKDLIIRKGAVSAHKGEKFILPFNQEDGILICEGKGNRDWNYSAPHGAGRIGSRSDAKKKAAEKGLVEKARERMKKSDIYSSVVPADELKDAYKDSAMIEKAIEPTANILTRIKPWYNIKGK